MEFARSKWKKKTLRYITEEGICLKYICGALKYRLSTSFEDNLQYFPVNYFLLVDIEF